MILNVMQIRRVALTAASIAECICTALRKAARPNTRKQPRGPATQNSPHLHLTFSRLLIGSEPGSHNHRSGTRAVEISAPDDLALVFGWGVAQPSCTAAQRDLLISFNPAVGHHERLDFPRNRGEGRYPTVCCRQRNEAADGLTGVYGALFVGEGKQVLSGARLSERRLRVFTCCTAK